MLRLTLAITIMNAFTMFGWWGFNLWLPSYLRLPRDAGGIGLSPSVMSAFVFAMQIGMWFGYVTFGFISDALGRKGTYVTYLIAAAALPLFVLVIIKTGSRGELGRPKLTPLGCYERFSAFLRGELRGPADVGRVEPELERGVETQALTDA